MPLFLYPNGLEFNGLGHYYYSLDQIGINSTFAPRKFNLY